MSLPCSYQGVQIWSSLEQMGARGAEAIRRFHSSAYSSPKLNSSADPPSYSMLFFLKGFSFCLWKISSARHEGISQISISTAEESQCCGKVLCSVVSRLEIAHLQTASLSASVESDEMEASMSHTSFLNKILTRDMGKDLNAICCPRAARLGRPFL